MRPRPRERSPFLSFVPIPALQRSFQQCGLSLLKSIAHWRCMTFGPWKTMRLIKRWGTGSASRFLEFLAELPYFWLLLACTASWPIQLTTAPTKLAFAWHWAPDLGTFLPPYFAMG